MRKYLSYATFVPAFYWGCTHLLRLVLWVVGRWRVEGRENVPATGALLIVANHLSNPDPPILAAAILKRRIRFMAKVELYKYPFGVVPRLYGAFPIRRFDADLAAIGPAPTGGRADETQPFTAGSLGIAYMNSKHEAEAEVLRAAARGLDAVIVNPTFVLGPGGGHASSMGLIRRFLLRRIPAYVDGGLNIVDVRDVADGHLLADAKGETGERYILGGRNFTLQRLFADLSRMSGVPAPQLKLPAQVAAAGARVSEQLGLPLGLAVDETRSAALWWTYSSARAKRELGFTPRPHEETLEDALDEVTEQLGDRVGGDPGAADSALSLAGRISRLAGRIPRP